MFRNFPLVSIHPNAMPSAKAAYCVGQQNPELFWALHDWLFVNQSAWSSAADAAARFRKQALTLGAEGAQYDACLQDAKTEAAIQRDLAEGTRLGVNGTPTFFLLKVDAQGKTVSSRSFVGAPPIEQFKAAIEAVLDPTPTPTK